MSVPEGGPKQATGQVKWFDPTKGFGFILDDGGGPDILLHANVLRSFGQSSVAEGSRMVVEVTPTARGLQATAILSLSPPPGDPVRPIAELAARDDAALAQLPFLPARVRWFDKAKGFGFANVFGQAADVFLHLEVLRHGGFADLASGEAVALRVMEGSRGLMAVQIAGWDRGVAQAAGQQQAQPAATGQPLADRKLAVVPPPPDMPPSPIGAEAVATPPLLVADQT